MPRRSQSEGGVKRVDVNAGTGIACKQAPISDRATLTKEKDKDKEERERFRAGGWRQRRPTPAGSGRRRGRRCRCASPPQSKPPASVRPPRPTARGRGQTGPRRLSSLG